MYWFLLAWYMFASVALIMVVIYRPPFSVELIVVNLINLCGIAMVVCHIDNPTINAPVRKDMFVFFTNIVYTIIMLFYPHLQDPHQAWILFGSCLIVANFLWSSVDIHTGEWHTSVGMGVLVWCGWSIATYLLYTPSPQERFINFFCAVVIGCVMLASINKAETTKKEQLKQPLLSPQF